MMISGRTTPFMDVFILLKIIFGVPRNIFLFLKSFHCVNFFPFQEIMFGVLLDFFLHRMRIPSILPITSIIRKNLTRFMTSVMPTRTLLRCRPCHERPSCR